jgi:hypothetical protein
MFIWRQASNEVHYSAMPNDAEDLWIRPATLNEARRMLLDPMRYSLVPGGMSAAGLTGERRKVALAEETIAMLQDPDIPAALAAAKSAQDDTCLFVVDETWIKGDVDFIRSATPGKETFVTESPFGVTTIFVLTSEGPLLIPTTPRTARLRSSRPCLYGTTRAGFSVGACRLCSPRNNQACTTPTS